jgi:membrane-associated protein
VLTTLLYSVFALDSTLAQLAAEHAWVMFVALFIVIFAETGLVVFPLLPGDSLLFIAGTVCAASGVNVHFLAIVLWAAAVFGDSVNYTIGRTIGPRAFDPTLSPRLSRWLKPEYLDRTHRFYEKYGGLTIVVGRFAPVVRTFAPFLAGVGQMHYRQFVAFNIVGGGLWVGLLVYAGFLFGNIPWVKDNLAYIVVAIIAVTLAPATIQYVREKRSRARR